MITVNKGYTNYSLSRNHKLAFYYLANSIDMGERAINYAGWMHYKRVGLWL